MARTLGEPPRLLKRNQPKRWPTIFLEPLQTATKPCVHIHGSLHTPVLASIGEVPVASKAGTTKRNQERTTSVISRFIAIGLLLLAWVSAQAQTSLEDMVNQGNAAWMLGKWEGPADDGTTVMLIFSWDLNKHVVVLHGKVGDMEFKGYSALEPGSGEVKYTGL